METPTLLNSIEEVITHLEELVGDAPQQGSLSRQLPGTDLVAAVSRIEHAGRIIDSLRTEVAHEVDARTLKQAPADPNDSLAHLYGFPSSNAMLKQLTLASGKTIARRLRVAKLCRTQVSLLGISMPSRFSHVGEAFFNGSLHMDSAETIATELNKLPSRVNHEHLDLAERVLVSKATGTELVPGAWDDAEEQAGIPVHADDIKVLTYGWAAALDQDGTLPREEQLGRRFFRIGEERNGLVPINGALLPEIAAGLGRMFDAINNPRIQRNNSGDPTDGPNARATGSNVRFIPVDTVPNTDEPAVFTDTRTGDQKRHDALATVINVAMKHSDMPQLGGEALTLTIQVTESDLAKQGGLAWITDAHGTSSLIDSAAARHAACVGNILKVQQDDNGRIIKLETHARVFNAHQRKAIILRDGGCIIPGCTISATWCEIHHVEEWAEGGPTHTDNGVLLCWFHHRSLETHGWHIRMQSGVPQVRPPAWLDPERAWRPARSVHRPPDLIDSRAIRRARNTNRTRSKTPMRA